MHVVDAFGRGLHDAHVEARFAGADEESAGYARGVTGTEGACELSGIAPRRVFLSVKKVGYLPKEESFEVPRDDAAMVSLDRGHRFTVRVIGEDWGPLAEAEVRRLHPPGESSEYRILTSPRGIAEYGGFAHPTVVKVKAAKDGYSSAVGEGRTGETIDLVLHRGGTIRFRFLSQGAPLPGRAAVSLSGEREAGDPGGTNRFSERFASPIEEGIAEVAGLRSGTYRAVLDLEGFSRAAAADIQVRAPDRTDVDIQLLAGGALEGRVLDARTGAPLSGATIDLNLAGERLGSVRNGPDGSFRFESVTGEVLLHVTHQDRCPSGPLGISVRSGEIVRLDDILLTAGSTIVCRVALSPEKAGEARLRCMSARDEGGYGRVIGATLGRPGTDGVYTHAFRHLGPGTYTISCSLGERKVLREVVVGGGDEEETEVSFDLE